MKILLAQKVLQLAGSEIYLLNLLPALREAGVDAHFALLCEDENAEVTKRFHIQLSNFRVPTYIFTLNKRPKLKQLRKINSHLARENYDLIHTHLFYSDLVFALIKTLFNKKISIVSTKHGYNEKYNNRYGFDVVYRFMDPYRILNSIVEKKISRSFAVSKALKDLYIGLKICNRSKVDVIYHGFNYEEVNTNDQFRFSPKQIVLVGRLTEFKGHRYAITALKKVVQKIPEAKLIIVGEGPLNETLQQLVLSFQLTENVIFLGFQKNAREVIASSDLLILPSVAEGFGLVLIEAMAAKKPIVAFNVPTPSEILENEKTALLTPPYNIDLLANNIIRLLSNSELADRIGKNAYKLQREQFNLQRMVAETIQFYTTVLEEPEDEFIKKAVVSY